MSKLKKKLAHRLKVFLMKRRDKKKFSPALSVERVSRTNNNLKRHMNIHTGGETVQHVICAGRVSTQSPHLQRHNEDPHWRETVHM